MKAKVQRALQEARLEHAIMCCFYTAVLTLNGEFGFGEKRLQQFSKKFGSTMKEYRDRYGEVTLDALKKHAEQKGIRIEEI